MNARPRAEQPTQGITLLIPAHLSAQMLLLPRTGVSAAVGLERLLEAFRSVQPYNAGHAPGVVDNVLCAVAWNGH